ncbi:PP2C family protein-serine/threonine phosphatase [Roseospira navarrensis]|uniref:SpoIIE family protein phosphatase n=1 Tax=Roseospira navarrensis TaxID=140058 RepID=A0A7X1ZEQ7_9PROT|nr:protein phosphatase 2C domain-containing protein [Roseospira navarrensis]MQX37136.1 SpoIIE family protein phosphatase [Roseospira navarrensis]
MNKGTQRIVSASASHVGLVRSVNEDNYLERPDIGLWAVADGMGGHSRGDLASQTVCRVLSEIPPPASGLELLNAVRDGLHAAHAELLDHAAALGGEETIGTTVVVLMVYQDHFACVWAGDSRCYLMRDGALTRVTHDHSVVQGMIDSGALAESEAEGHPLSNVVTQALGARGDLEPASVHGPLAPGDMLLLCSDGLSRMVPDADIADTLGRYGLGSVDHLIDQALSAGGRDNVTVVVVTTGGADPARSRRGDDFDSDDTAIHWRDNGHG